MSEAAPALPRAAFAAGARAVLERDFLVFTSRGRFLVLRTLTVAVPAAIVLCMLWSEVSFETRYGNSARIGEEVFGCAAVVVPVLVLFLAPVLAASSIASERSLRTLPVVLAAPVSPLGFVAAKFLSRLATVLVLVVATLPIAGICFLYGGISVSKFLDLVAFATALAVLGTAAGTLASAFSRSVSSAVGTAYGLAALLPLAHALTFAWRTSIWTRGGTMPFDAVLNPFLVWGNVLPTGMPFPGWTRPALWLLASTAVLAAGAIALGAWRIAREGAHEAAPAASRRRGRGMRFANPVLDRGVRGTLLAHPHVAAWVRLAMVLVIQAGFLYGASRMDRWSETAGWSIAFMLTVTTICAVSCLAASAHSIAQERQETSLDMLLASPLTVRDIVAGKLKATLLGVLPLLALPLLQGLVAAAAGTGLRPAVILTWCVTTAVILFAVSSLGIWVSSRATTASRAVLTAFAILVGGTILHGVAVGILAAMTRGGEDEVLTWLGGMSPVFVGGVLPVMAEEDRWSNSVQESFVAGVLWSGTYVVVSIGLLRAAVASLKRRNVE